MRKFIIFTGNVKNKADIKANEWLKEHLHISIINVSYQQANLGEHSICIFYEED